MEEISKNKKIFTILLIVFIIVGAILIPICFYQFMGFLIVIYLFLGSIFLMLFHYYKIKKPFKENVIPLILKEYKSSLEFIPKLTEKEDYISMIREHKLIPSATSFNFTDGIIDEIEGHKASSFDLHATHTQSTGKSTTTVTDFKGRFYDIEYPDLNCDFIIKEEYLKRVPNGYEFLELEHIEFNNVFNIYVTDKHEAFKVFTPSVIKKYYELAGEDLIKTIVHYSNNHLYVYINNSENLFETTDEDYKEAIISDYKNQYDNMYEYLKTFTYYKLN